MMEDWRCPLCAGREAAPCFSRLAMVGARQNTFSVVRCRGCGLFLLHPRPQPLELLGLYPPDYEAFWGPLGQTSSRWLRWTRRRHYAYRCRAVQRAQPGGGWLLDIGCGSGGFLHALSLSGAWRGVGMDIHPGALDIARGQGACVWRGEASAVGLPSASFDVVTMWEVIEHVPAPRQALSEVYRILKPGGKLLLSTPNSASWQARCWGEHWIGWDVPRHVQIFSFQTLRRALDEAGFAVVRRLSFPGERFYAVESARRWAQGHGTRVTRFVGHVARAAGWATWPALRLADATPWASCIALEARAV